MYIPVTASKDAEIHAYDIVHSIQASYLRVSNHAYQQNYFL